MIRINCKKFGTVSIEENCSVCSYKDKLENGKLDCKYILDIIETKVEKE